MDATQANSNTAHYLKTALGKSELQVYVQN